MANQLYVTAAEAADMLGGISIALVYKLAKENRLKHLRIGRRIMIPKMAINALIENEVEEI